MKTKRDPVPDCIRGIGILLMVMGHSGFAGSDWIYLFHMALFFILSGYLYRSANTENPAALGRYFLRKIKTLWLPFVAANTFFTVCNNLFLRVGILTADTRLLELPGNLVHAPVTLKDVVGRTLHWCLFDGGTQLGGALWFVQALFQLSLLYALCEFLLRHLLPKVDPLWPQAAIALLLLGVGSATRGSLGVWSLHIVASSYCLYWLGAALRRLGTPVQTPMGRCAVWVGCFAALAVLGRFGSVGLAGNQYPGPLFLLAASLCGWGLVYETARFAVQCAPLRRVLCYMGQHSMAVAALHFLAFKAVTAVQLALTGGERYLLAAFPVYHTEGLWWLAYTAAGVALPLAAAALWQLVRTKLAARLTQKS